MKKKSKVAACDCCGGPNERAEWSNYCAKCADEYNRRVKKNRDEYQKQHDDYWRNRPY